MKDKVGSKPYPSICLASKEVMEESHKIDDAVGMFPKKYGSVCEAPSDVEDFQERKVDGCPQVLPPELPCV